MINIYGNSRVKEDILKNSKVRGFSLLHIETNVKAIVMKILWPGYLTPARHMLNIPVE